MATIGQVYAAVEAVTISLASLANGAEAISSPITNAVNKHLAADIEINITNDATAVTGTHDIYLERSGDNTVFSSGSYGVDSNRLFITSVTPIASTLVTKVVRIEQLPKGYNIVVVNKSGGAISTGTINLYGVSLSNA